MQSQTISENVKEVFIKCCGLDKIIPRSEKPDWITQPIHTGLTKTNSTELSPAWEAASRSATKEFPNILLNLKAQYRVHKRPSLVPTLSQINPVHTTPSYLRSILILFSHLCLGLPSGFFSFWLSHYMHCPSPQACYMSCPYHPRLLDHSNYTTRRVQVIN
jgi:hypothetical protein